MKMAYLLMLVLAATMGLKQQSGLATVYHPGDRSCGKERADGKRFTSEDDHIAHRWLPLGTKGFICNQRTNKCTFTVVRDRGPFGAIRPCTTPQPEPFRIAGKTFSVMKIKWGKDCYWWQAQPGRLQHGFKYRGSFDVTKPVAQRIGMRGFDKVVFYYGASEWKKKHQSFPAPQDSAISLEQSRMRLENEWGKCLALSNP